MYCINLARSAWHQSFYQDFTLLDVIAKVIFVSCIYCTKIIGFITEPNYFETEDYRLTMELVNLFSHYESVLNALLFRKDSFPLKNFKPTLRPSAKLD